MGFVAGFQIATFAFVGIELVGTTAAEPKNPERNLPKAINSIPVRVMLFYVVALIAIISVTPWRQISADRSPFVVMFTLAGLGIAASVINFVVLTSAASSANSGIYSTSRMVYGLAQEGDAPARFGRLTSRKVPVNALLLSGLFLLPGVVMVTMGDSIIEAFTLVTTISALLFIFVWSIILICYLVYRKRRPHLRGVDVQDAWRRRHVLRRTRLLRVPHLGTDPEGEHPAGAAGDSGVVRHPRHRMGGSPSPSPPRSGPAGGHPRSAPSSTAGGRSRFSTDLGTCKSNRVPDRVFFRPYAQESRASW
ncbi:Putrescine transporter PotE [Streptomyces hirsutus]